MGNLQRGRFGRVTPAGSSSRTHFLVWTISNCGVSVLYIPGRCALSAGRAESRYPVVIRRKNQAETAEEKRKMPKVRQLVFVLVVGVVALAMSVRGQDPAGMPAGLLRDESALGLTPTTANWGMGGAYVGLSDVSSMNPAALGFVENSSLSLGAVYWNSHKGPTAGGGRTDLVIPFLYGGYARIMGYRYESNSAQDAAGGVMDLEYKSTTIGAQIGVPITENIAIGVGVYPYEKAEIDLLTPMGTLRGEAMSKVGSMQLGLQWKVTDTVTVGAEGIYIVDKMTVNDADDKELQADRYQITYGALGFSWQVREGTVVAADWRRGEIEGDALMSSAEYDVNVDRWAVGISQTVTDWLVVRAGSDNGGLTLGAGLTLGEKFRLDYAYVNEAYIDKEDTLGETKLHTLAVSMDF